MELLGFETEPRVAVETFTCHPRAIMLGDGIELTATIRSAAPYDQHLVVDYVIHHPTATGAISSKVFTWTNLRLGVVPLHPWAGPPSG